MFDSALLDVAIGLVFLYLTLSLVVTAAVEAIQTFLDRRARELENGLREMLQNDDLVDRFYDHPLIKALYRGKRSSGKLKLPDYIPSRTFALTLLDLIMPAKPDRPSGAAEAMAPSKSAHEAGRPSPVGPLRAAVLDLEAKDVQQALLTLIDAAGDDIEQVRENVENWYDDTMERVSSWFKRWAHVIGLAIATLVVVGANADTIQIATDLARNDALREALVGVADNIAQDQANPTAVGVIEDLQKASVSIGLPLGWEKHCVPTSNSGWIVKIIGWILSALAVSLGAPFWFDLLKRFVNVRAAVEPKPDED